MSTPPPHLIPPPPDWVLVCKENGRRVRKFPTYGGWLYQIQTGVSAGNEVVYGETTFVPDARRLPAPRVVG